MKIKICFAVSSLANLGPPNVIFNIIKYMDFDKFSISIVTMAPEKEISRMKDFQNMPIAIFQLAPDWLKNGISLGLAFHKILMKIQPDIVHVHCPRSILLATFIPHNCKRVVTIHNFPNLSIISYGKYKGRVIKWLRMIMTKRIENRVACSESIADTYNKMNIVTKAIPNGCSYPLWKYDAQEKRRLRQLLNLCSEKRWFLYIGAFNEGKKPDLIIEAFEKMNNPQLGLVLIGSGSLYANLVKHKSDSIKMPGFCENVLDYARACDYYISASVSEGMPNALLESLSVGLPSVLSNIPAHREVVRKANIPVNSFFECDDIEGLIRAIKEIVNRNYDEMRSEVQNIYENNYTARIMSEKYQKLYKAIYYESR